MAKQGETLVWQRLMLELVDDGFRLFRNQRYKGRTEKGFWVDTGVGGNGGSDLIGYRIIQITPDMVGQNIAQFVAIETKYGNNGGTKEQKVFCKAIQNNGGFACFARNKEDVKNSLTKSK